MKKSSSAAAFVVSLICIIALFSQCKKIAPEKIADEEKSYSARTTGDTTRVSLKQLVVWRKPGFSPQQVRAWIKSIEKKGPVDTLRICQSCDSSLLLLGGASVETYIQGNTVSGGQSTGKGTPTPPSGEDGPVFHSLNFRVKNNDKVPFNTHVSLFKGLVQTGKDVKVAVLDTGVDTTGIKNYLYIANKSNVPCFKPFDAQAGWNFAGHNQNYDDDDPDYHGTTVTRFVTDQSNKYVNKVEILPVKTHGGDGSGDLFTILCAIGYASERKVKIVNASFGFYVPRLEKLNPAKFPIDPNVRLLREYVLHFLTKKKILLVAAAGNKDDANEIATFQDHGIPPSRYPNNPRDLDDVSFYPASLARDTALFWNVFAVTTTFVDANGNGTVSPFQNFSSHVVDIGVNADTIIPVQHYVFNNPRLKGGQTVEGSSFSTPIVTGMLCGNYGLIEPFLAGSTVSKFKIFNALGSLVSSNTSLANKIRGGRVTTRKK